MIFSAISMQAKNILSALSDRQCIETLGAVPQQYVLSLGSKTGHPFHVKVLGAVYGGSMMG